MLLFSPVDGNTETGYSNITVVSTETGQKGPAYEALKPVLEEAITAELITSQLAQQGITATITDFKTSDSDTELGKAFKIEYTVNLEESTFTQTIYEIYIDNYNLEIAITDIGDGVTPDVNVVGEYLIKSLTISK